ncbi:hypothetical protein TRFO_04736 [Tritrichomonas foetus]|uniref:Uncharacterized protein n=1 Tax=Tritrichomonas foetus TaxID=1144522 RepID=A0A1J4KGA6_9EUKA|nr:hypothetical protein TRFO_04736 [Tritrichomonas foetus]|eukprot:OHT08678.1 hypothetical protein TRFO_04736 [Tritrichomonas foetus]
MSFEEKDKFLNYNKSNPEKKESNEKEIKEKEIKEITVDFLLPSNFFDPKNEEENSEDKSQEEEEEEAEEYEFNNDFTVDFNNGINDPSIQTVNSLIYQSIRRQNPFVEANKISDTVKNMQPNLMAWKRMFAASYQMGNMYGQNYMMGNADQT